ncbi:MAG: ParB/RepB/Spo0J family partition protein [Thermodesulfobacteriota bacterium]
MTTTPRTGLGKGLSALLPSRDDEHGHRYFLCPVGSIRPNPRQPRKLIKPDELEELAASIREKGIIQPLVVRRLDEDGYELIAGERRWRASQLAGLEEVPVVVKDVSPDEALELALIENIQRQDLNPLEEAEAYARLVEELRITQEEVARRVGKERSTVANYLRILALPDWAKEDLVNDRLSMGHAKVLLAVDEDEPRRALRDEILAKALSVRQTEARARRLRQQSSRRPRRRPAAEAAAIPESYAQVLQNDLQRHLGTRVRIVQAGSRGRLEIDYFSADDLERLLDLIVPADRR